MHDYLSHVNHAVSTGWCWKLTIEGFNRFGIDLLHAINHTLVFESKTLKKIFLLSISKHFKDPTYGARVSGNDQII